jgi:hypothetical protein
MQLFPAAYLGSVELAWSLRDMDLDEVLVVAPARRLRRLMWVPHAIANGLTSVTAAIRAIETWCKQHCRRPTSLLGIDDEEQFRIAGKIAAHFDLPFYEPHTLAVASNKYLMKQRFVRCGVPTGRFTLLSETNGRLRDVGFPNVLKIISGSGSEFLFLNRNAIELTTNRVRLQQAVARSRDTRFRKVSVALDGADYRLDPRQQFLLEEYIGGDEYSCDFLIQRGTVRLLRVVRKYPSAHFGYFAGYYLLNRNSLQHAGVDPDELRGVCKRVAQALDVRDAVCMVDFKANAGGLRVIETSIRPGLSTFIPLMKQVYGYTSLGVLSRLRRALAVTESTPRAEGLCVYFFADGAGRVRRIDTTGLDALRAEVDLLDTHLYYRRGTRVRDTVFDHIDLVAGYALIRNPGRERVPELLERVAKAVHIEVEPDNCPG